MILILFFVPFYDLVCKPPPLLVHMAHFWILQRILIVCIHNSCSKWQQSARCTFLPSPSKFTRTENLLIVVLDFVNSICLNWNCKIRFATSLSWKEDLFRKVFPSVNNNKSKKSIFNIHCFNYYRSLIYRWSKDYHILENNNYAVSFIQLFWILSYLKCLLFIEI